MQWNESYGESVYTFANTINTHEGGTHEEGFRSALTGVVNKYGADKKFLKGDEKLSGEDIREGLAAIISVKLANPQFEGQTKTKLGNTPVKSFVQRVCNEWLADWLERNPGRGEDDHHEGHAGGPRADRRAAGAQAGPAQVAAGVRLDAGQAGRLPVDRPARVRGVHRRGRLGRRLGQAGPRPADPGDPADPRQDPQRGEGPDRPGAEEQRGPGADHRAGHRHPRRLRHREAALPQDRADGRRRRRRPAHPDAAAHAAVPVHASAGRARVTSTWPRRRSTRSSGTRRATTRSTRTPTASATA